MNKPMQNKVYRVKRNDDWKLHSLRDFEEDGMVMLKAEMSRALKGSVDLKKG